MALQNPPAFLQTQPHPAEGVRRMTAALAGTGKGVNGAADMFVSAATAMNLNVAGGTAWIPGSESIYQGSYFVENRGATTVTVTGGNATFPRKDLVVARVQDATYSGAVSSWSLAVIAGTPAASPTLPTAPVNSIILATLDVPANASAIASVTITDVRPRATPPTVPIFANATDRLRGIPAPVGGMLSVLWTSGVPRIESYDAGISTWKRIVPTVTVSSAAPSGGEAGDVWLQV
jgi:hypothetical protein